MPVYPGNYIRNIIAGRNETDRLLEEQKEAAIRWQGAQDYQTLVQSGIDPRDALQRTAPKLFYNDPRALAATVPSMLSQETGLITDPVTGRRFTRDRFGNLKAVSEPQYGWRRTSDPFGNAYTVRLGPGEPVPTGQEPRQAPPIYTAPGGGRVFLMPGAKIRNVPAPAVSKAEADKMTEEAWKAAEPILKNYNKWKAEDISGEVRWAWDWTGIGESYQQKMKRAEEQLKQIGYDTEGRIIPESRLGEAYYGSRGGTEEGITGQIQPGGVVPPGRAPIPAEYYGTGSMQGMRPPQRPRVQRTPLPGGGFMLQGVPAAPTAPAARTRRQPGPGEVIKQRVLPDGRVIRAIFNASTHEFIDYAD